jgi:AraC-like DNA-binding protein
MPLYDMKDNDILAANGIVHYGLAPLQYLTKCRMQRAAHDQVCSCGKISRVAEKAGYGDQFAFSVAFSRFHRLSPREFRKRNARTI